MATNIATCLLLFVVILILLIVHCRPFPLLHLSTLYIVEEKTTRTWLVTNGNTDGAWPPVTNDNKHSNQNVVDSVSHGNSLDRSISSVSRYEKVQKDLLSTAGVHVTRNNNHLGNYATYLHNEPTGAVTNGDHTVAWTQAGTDQDVKTVSQPQASTHNLIKPKYYKTTGKWRSVATDDPERNILTSPVENSDDQSWNVSTYNAYAGAESSMVYVVNTANEATPVTYLSGNLSNLSLNIHFQLKDVVLAACGTVGCMFTICMLITFTRCCCRRNKDSDSETDNDDPGTEQADYHKSSVKHKKGKVSKTRSSDSCATASVTQVTVENSDDEYIDTHLSHRDKDKLR